MSILAGVLFIVSIGFLHNAASWSGDPHNRPANYAVGAVLMMTAVILWRFS